jgi:hypothetical protein
MKKTDETEGKPGQIQLAYEPPLEQHSGEPPPQAKRKGRPQRTWTNTICRQDGCESSAVKAGYCMLCYGRHHYAKRTGNWPAPRRSWTNTICLQKGCDEEPKKLGYCIQHYNQRHWRGYTGQNPDGPKLKSVRRTWKNTICAAEGCDKAPERAPGRGVLGFCQIHYQRLWWEQHHEKNPGLKEKLAKEVAKRNRERFTGFSHELFEQRSREQKGKCPICDVTLLLSGRKNESATADHCHQGHLPRGVPCRGCNVSLGVYENHQRKVPGFTIEAYERYLNRWGCFRSGCQHPERPPRPPRKPTSRKKRV